MVLSEIPMVRQEVLGASNSCAEGNTLLIPNIQAAHRPNPSFSTSHGGGATNKLHQGFAGASTLSVVKYDPILLSLLYKSIKTTYGLRGI